MRTTARNFVISSRPKTSAHPANGQQHVCNWLRSTTRNRIAKRPKHGSTVLLRKRERHSRRRLPSPGSAHAQQPRGAVALVAEQASVPVLGSLPGWTTRSRLRRRQARGRVPSGTGVSAEPVRACELLRETTRPSRLAIRPGFKRNPEVANGSISCPRYCGRPWKRSLSLL